MARVFHVGLMKSGTTFLQEILSANRAELEDMSWLYPGTRMNQQHACYGLCKNDIPWVPADSPYESIADQLVRDIQEYPGDVIVSSEALSSLDAAGVKRFLNRVGGPPDKVIFTVRALDKLIPSAWQQNLKSGSTESFGTYLRRLSSDHEDGRGAWRTYGYGKSIRTWAEHCPVNVVVVPTRESSHVDGLWTLFQRATGLPSIPNTQVKSENANVSLTQEAAEIMVLLNKLFISNGVGKARSRNLRSRFLEEGVFPLADKTSGTRIRVPLAWAERLREWNETEISLLKSYASGVYGDSKDLEASSVSTSPAPEDNTAAVASEIILKILEGSSPN